ncbi:hypothetical protein GCM10009551_004340 [Nocardiopsis tropica]
MRKTREISLIWPPGQVGVTLSGDAGTHGCGSAAPDPSSSLSDTPEPPAAPCFTVVNAVEAVHVTPAGVRASGPDPRADLRDSKTKGGSGDRVRPSDRGHPPRTR